MELSPRGPDGGLRKSHGKQTEYFHLLQSLNILQDLLQAQPSSVVGRVCGVYLGVMQTDWGRFLWIGIPHISLLLSSFTPCLPHRHGFSSLRNRLTQRCRPSLEPGEVQMNRGPCPEGPFLA